MYVFQEYQEKQTYIIPLRAGFFLFSSWHVGYNEEQRITDKDERKWKDKEREKPSSRMTKKDKCIYTVI